MQQMAQRAGSTMRWGSIGSERDSKPKGLVEIGIETLTVSLYYFTCEGEFASRPRVLQRNPHVDRVPYDRRVSIDTLARLHISETWGADLHPAY
jgi:hypothetical protein